MRPASTRIASLLAAGFVATLISPAAAQTCTPVRFEPGQSTATLRGSVPAEDSVCYTFGAKPGQTATLNVSGRNIIASVIGVGDARTSWSFKTKAQNQFIIGQMMRSVTPENFTAILSIR